MGIEILITVAIASGSSVSAVWFMLWRLERSLDGRLDDIEKAILQKQHDITLINQRIERLEDHENQEARNLRTALGQIQQWIDLVASPVAVRTEP